MGDGSVLKVPRFDPKGKSRAATPTNGDILALDLGAAEEGAASPNGDAFMQMQLVEQQVRVDHVWGSVWVVNMHIGFVHPVSVNGNRIY